MNYQSAYERQKKARERAENLLEDRSRELYDTNQNLQDAYDKLKAQKAQLLHQEKLASIGQLAAGVAHEINTPTGFLKSNIHCLQRYLVNIKIIIDFYHDVFSKLESKQSSEFEQHRNELNQLEEETDLEFILEEIPELIQESIFGAEHIEKIVLGLKNFSRADKDDKELFSINNCIENTLKLINNEIKDQLSFDIHLSASITINGFPGQISQVVLNMIVNASQAIPEQGGKITLSTHTQKGFVIVTIADNGHGMDEKTMHNIFDPFFTTKAVGVGTGLGLSISHGIIKNHDGCINVDSIEGKGTTFTIQLPLPKNDDIQ